jgi:hypothetical protein
MADDDHEMADGEEQTTQTPRTTRQIATIQAILARKAADTALSAFN